MCCCGRRDENNFSRILFVGKGDDVLDIDWETIGFDKCLKG